MIAQHFFSTSASPCAPPPTEYTVVILLQEDVLQKLNAVSYRVLKLCGVRRLVLAPPVKVHDRASCRHEGRAAAVCGRRWLSSDDQRAPRRALVCEIWSRLSVSERIAASHVCRRWRVVALARPALWTDILIFPVSYGRLHASFGPQAFLDRSSRAPLSCVVDVPKHADDADVARLANMLSARWPRVASLQLHCARADHRAMLIPGTTPLPRLKGLGMHSLEEHHIGISAMRLPVMPALTSLSLAENVQWDCAVPTFPALHSLEAWFSSPKQILFVLMSCRRLSILDAAIAFPNPIPQGVCKPFGQAVSRVREIYVRFLPAAWDEHTLTAFGDSRVHAIAFDYHSAAPLQTVPGLCVLRHLQGAVSLDITEEPNARLKIVGRDAGGRTRTVTWGMEWMHDANVQALWAALSPASVASLCVDWRLRIGVLRAQSFFPALEALALRFPSSFADRSRQYEIPATNRLIAPMPCLSRVSLQSDATVTFPADELAQFLLMLSPSRRLGVLELRNVLLQDETDLGAVAEKIVHVSL